MKLSETTHEVSNLLNIQHRTQGLRLFESEDFVTLTYKGVEVAHWYGVKATMAAIHEEADKWLPSADAVQDMVDRGGIEISKAG